MKENLIKISFLAIFLFSFSCTTLRQRFSPLKTPDNFTQIDQNIYVENKYDKVFAEGLLTELIDSVQSKYLHKFINPPIFYICNNEETFYKYTGLKSPGPGAFATPKGVIISPKLKESVHWYATLYHELSNALLLQYTGGSDYPRIPVWFNEGFISYISNGGGTGDVTEGAAIVGIRSGNHFSPIDGENSQFQEKSKDKKNNTGLYNYQAMLFVKFLKKENERGFEDLLNSIFNKEPFLEGFKSAYKEDLSVLWTKFLDNKKK